MSSFSVEQEDGLINATHVSGIPITSADPTDGSVLVYDSAIDQFGYQPIIAGSGNQIIAGNQTFLGTTKFGSGGSAVSQIEFGSVSVPGVIAPATDLSVTITYAAFTSIPRVYATVQSTLLTCVPLIVTIEAKSTTSATAHVRNNSAVLPSTGTLSIDWVAEL